MANPNDRGSGWSRKAFNLCASSNLYFGRDDEFVNFAFRSASILARCRRIPEGFHADLRQMQILKIELKLRPEISGFTGQENAWNLYYYWARSDIGRFS
jgi:hypothetical protein